MSVHKRAQLVALDMGEEKLTAEIILGTQKFFKLTNPMIKSLDSNDRHLRGLYPDISMEVFNIIETVSRKRMTDEEFVDVVMNNHFTEEEIQMIFNAFVSRFKPSKSDKEGKDSKDETKTVSPMKNDSSKKVKKEKQIPAGDILKKVEQVKTKEDMYSVLKEAGLIGLPGANN
jgi:hypothetical protein